MSAKLQGFDPMKIRFIRRAHEAGLGIGDPRQIKIVGYDIENEPDWGFRQGGAVGAPGPASCACRMKRMRIGSNPWRRAETASIAT